MARAAIEARSTWSITLRYASLTSSPTSMPFVGNVDGRHPRKYLDD
jgi:hypothetical protein